MYIHSSVINFSVAFIKVIKLFAKLY